MRVLMLLGVLSCSVVTAGCGKPPCSASTCATGCCDASGTCQAGTQTLACGIAGGTCSSCTLAQQCIQGTCFGATGGGGGSGGGTGGGGAGGGGAGGGGLGGGVGGGSTGGGGGLGIRLIPTSATVPLNASVELAAELTGGAPDQLINWSIESGAGSLFPSGPSTATYYATSGTATVRIRAQAVFLSSLATFADFVVYPSASDFIVVPQSLSGSPYALAIGAQQSFAAVRRTSPSSLYEGLQVNWTVWPQGSIAAGTVTIASGMSRIYARDPSSNVWASADLSPQSTALPSVAVSPSLASVGPNGVVQFTANISTGAAAQWTALSANGGSISSSGTYTAPSTPGVYVVAAQPVGGNGLRFGVATIVVQ